MHLLHINLMQSAAHELTLSFPLPSLPFSEALSVAHIHVWLWLLTREAAAVLMKLLHRSPTVVAVAVDKRLESVDIRCANYNEVTFSRKENNYSLFYVLRIPTCLCEHTCMCVCVWRAYIYDMWYMHMIDMWCMWYVHASVYRNMLTNICMSGGQRLSWASQSHLERLWRG